MPDYSKMTQEDFNNILTNILSRQTGAQLLSIPGIYEVVSEHFNNEILEEWEEPTIEEKENQGRITEYLSRGGNNCLFCGSTDLDCDPMDVDNNIAWQAISCNFCKATWQDQYKLIDVDRLERGEK